MIPDYAAILPPEYHPLATKIEDYLAANGSATVGDLYSAAKAGSEKASYTSTAMTMAALAAAKRIRLRDNRVYAWKQ